jgi:hypothetical protein
VRLYGVDNQGSWQAGEGGGEMPEGGADAPLVGGASMILQADSGGGNGGPVAFESSPTRMEWSPDYYEAFYVPLGQ